MKTRRPFIIVLIILLSHSYIALGSNTQTRIDNDIAIEKPIVIQVSVALADNKNQWIVPVPEAIGNGQDARTNLYWGARYGVKTYMIKDGGWEKVVTLKPHDKRILERLVLKKIFSRNGYNIPVYIVADAWDGKFIKDTIEHFLNYNAGKDVFDVQLKDKKLHAGGNAHLIVYVGHNALMDYVGVKNLTISNPKAESNKIENDAIVLACKSEQYFLPRLKKLGSSPLLLTTGLMAPEAYSLHAAIKQWIAGGNEIQVKKAAAESYNKYQKTGRRAAERLFGAK
ncbi:MAG: hypothetical protein ABIK92_21120 [Pseudomonadota bacterium]